MNLYCPLFHGELLLSFLGPDGPHNFHPGNHGPPGPVSNGPRPLLSMRLPDQRRGNFRGRPAAPRGGQRGGGPRGGGGGGAGAGAGGGGAGGGPRPRFQVPPPRGGNREVVKPLHRFWFMRKKGKAQLKG